MRMSLTVVNIMVFDRVMQFRDACAEEINHELVVTRNGRTIARFWLNNVPNWWIDEAAL
jgi:hypothetical protein